MDSPARANAYGNTGMETEVRQLKVRRERDATRRDATRHDDDDRDEDVEIKIEIKSRTDAETSPTRVRAGSSTKWTAFALLLKLYSSDQRYFAVV